MVENLSFDIPPGAIVGIIGPNGAGKTTLFRMITGMDHPDQGELRIGDSVKLGTCGHKVEMAWMMISLCGKSISDGKEVFMIGNAQVNARAYAARFGFTGQSQQQRVGDLSGGERNRVHLARMLKSHSNVLLLDEPTNDLDVNIMRALEEALETYAGCALIISHDRWFLDRIATHILAFEGDSQAVWFDGNYSAYDADRRKRRGVEADQPHRIKYRKLTLG